MPYRLSFLALLFALLVLIAALGPASALANQRVLPTAPEALVLRPGDLPKTFRLTGGGPVTPQEIAKAIHLSLDSLNRNGCVLAFETRFTRHGYTGIIGVMSEVTQCKSAAGADWYYGRLLDNARRYTRATHGQFQQFPVGYIGHERTGYVFVATTEDNVVVMAHVTFFRRGPYVAQVLVLSGEGGFLPGQAVQIAQIVDRRIVDSR
jgi:hypothetical protein